MEIQNKANIRIRMKFSARVVVSEAKAGESKTEVGTPLVLNQGLIRQKPVLLILLIRIRNPTTTSKHEANIELWGRQLNSQVGNPEFRSKLRVRNGGQKQSSQNSLQ